MRDLSPAFQPDRPGSPGFQVGAFQTQTPAVVGALGAVVTLGSIVQRIDAAPVHAVVGDLRAVVQLGASVRWMPVVMAFPIAPGRGRRARYAAYRGQLEAVVTLGARVRFTDEIERDDEDVLLLLLTGSMVVDDAAALLALVREDDAIVEALRGRG